MYSHTEGRRRLELYLNQLRDTASFLPALTLPNTHFSHVRKYVIEVVTDSRKTVNIDMSSYETVLLVI